jgi:superfamily II DNA/RNA helicase
MKFEEFNLSKELQETIRRLGFTSPTQIQEKAIHLVVQGKDVVGESATGSGKTLVFGCGIVERVIPHGGLQALVLTPTRELAEQIKNSLKQLSRDKHLTIITTYGGVSINPQIHDLRKADVVIATPGRLLDHLNRGTINLSKINLLVLDEADRMFDMGFIDDVERILHNCPKERQTLFFSATITPNIKNLAKKHMINPVTVLAENMVDPSKLKQVYYNIPRNMKLSLLVDLLNHEKSSLVMVFCNTRRSVDFLVKNLRANKINAIAIHGGLSQNKRANTMSLFNSARVSVLICTDVASRGLHIENVSHIYNYEIPKDSKDYIHRIGRTARAGKEGKVINILSENDYSTFNNVLRDYNNFSIERLEKHDFNKLIPIMEDRRQFGNRTQRFGNQRNPSRRGPYHRRDDSQNYPRKRYFSNNKR